MCGRQCRQKTSCVFQPSAASQPLACSGMAYWAAVSKHRPPPSGHAETLLLARLSVWSAAHRRRTRVIRSRLNFRVCSEPVVDSS